MARDKDCPKCGQPMELIDDEPDVGIVGGYECDCGYTEPMDDDDMEPFDIEGARP